MSDPIQTTKTTDDRPPVTCPACGGEGHVYQQECNLCAGLGMVSAGDADGFMDIIVRDSNTPS
jgi:RecJ-like exonuclease